MKSSYSFFKKNIRIVMALLIIIALMAATSALAAGAFDPTFGTNGKVTTAIGAGAVVLQPDGKIVVAGSSYNDTDSDFALARYNSNGTLDTTFSTDGLLTTDFNGDDDWGSAVALQLDGKIVLAGYSFNGSNNDFALARYNSSGTLDTTFSTDGMLTTDFNGDWDYGYAVAVQTDGKIIVAGTSTNSSSGEDFTLARYNSDGTLDTTFSTDGMVTTDFFGDSDGGYAIALQPDGKIVVAGNAYDAGWYRDHFALARYNSDGTLDTTFGGDGKVAIEISIYGDQVRAVILQPDGKIVLAGYSNTRYAGWNFALARFTSTGSLDTTFGSGGIVTTSIGTDSDRAYAVALQPDGKIVMTGYSYNDINGQVIPLVRYTSAGTLDATFGVNGIVTFDFGGEWDSGNALAIQPDGKIIVAGDGLARYDPGYALPPPSNLTATTAGPTQIDLSWDDNSSNESGFNVERSPAGDNTWTGIFTTTAETTTYSDTTVFCGTPYDYRVVAFSTDLLATSLPSNVATATSAACQPPSAFNKSSPANGATGQPTNPTVSWESSDNANSYEYCYDTTNDTACSFWIDNGAAASVSLSDLHPNTTYYWHVRAINSGNTTYSNGSDTAFWSFKTYRPSGDWGNTGTLVIARISHTATLLPDGKVLVVGGLGRIEGELVDLTSAELYDPATNLWTATGSLNIARKVHTATLLPNGQVLVAGGGNNSAELYDPATGLWTTTDSMSASRYGHTATLLPNGLVLVAGGGDSSAELYNPATGLWTTTGSMTRERDYHTATLLPNGKVLVAGGSGGSSNPLASTELYDPATGLWTTTGFMAWPRYDHTATLLPNGKVLVAGGYQGNHTTLATAELYDPATGTWTNTGTMNYWRYYHSATLLPDGRVLVAGGFNDLDRVLASAELYDPAIGAWSSTGSMNYARHIHTDTLLLNGTVLVAGGSSDAGLVWIAELYYPDTMVDTTSWVYLPVIQR